MSRAVGDLNINQRAMIKIMQEFRDDQRRGVWRSTEPPRPSELPSGVEPARQ
jgi:hypothetical protein